MLKLPCKVLDFPKPAFVKETFQHTRKGLTNSSVTQVTNVGSRWKIPHKSHFFRSNPKPLKFRFICEGHMNPEILPKYRDEFRGAVDRLCQLSGTDVSELETDNFNAIGDIDSKISKANIDGANLVIFLFKKQNIPIYAKLKDAADRTNGVHSLCLVQRDKLINNAPQNRFPEYMENVVMKVNLKMGGVTQSIPTVEAYLRDNRIMILGADVVHAGPTAFPGTPSIAAIVSSVDFSAEKCLGSMRLQPIVKDNREVRSCMHDTKLRLIK
jgi:eukaryotic translation initiation factor 2C